MIISAIRAHSFSTSGLVHQPVSLPLLGYFFNLLAPQLAAVDWTKFRALPYCYVVV